MASCLGSHTVAKSREGQDREQWRVDPEGCVENHNLTSLPLTLGQYPGQDSGNSFWGGSWGETKCQVLWYVSMGTFEAKPDVPREILSEILYYILY